MSRNSSAEPVPEAEGKPVYEAAQRAKQANRRVFSCSVVVSFTTGSGLGMGGKKTSRIDQWDPSALIEAIEGVGWRLEYLTHVWEQTEHNASLGSAAVIRGLTRAYMTFRTA